MSFAAVQAQFQDQLTQFGKAALNAIYPKDFNYYYLALELVDSQGITVDFFAWPILPSVISDTHNEITTVRKTMGGVNTMKNPTFAPRTINLSGTFGRTFKILLGQSAVEFAGFAFSIKNGKFNVQVPNLLQGDVPQFSTFAKTGYGCIKVLESMKEKSKKLDQHGKPFLLYLYDPILGNNYQVEIINFRHTENDSQNNMIPAYDITMTAVAPLDALFGRLSTIKSTLKNLTLGNLQKTANGVASQLRLIPGL